jgi:hypothetical protein
MVQSQLLQYMVIYLCSGFSVGVGKMPRGVFFWQHYILASRHLYNSVSLCHIPRQVDQTAQLWLRRDRMGKSGQQRLSAPWCTHACCLHATCGAQWYEWAISNSLVTRHSQYDVNCLLVVCVCRVLKLCIKGGTNGECATWYAATNNTNSMYYCWTNSSLYCVRPRIKTCVIINLFCVSV